MCASTRIAIAVCTILALCLTLTPVQGATKTIWQDLVHLDCNGNARLFPSHPVLRLGVNASLITNLYSTVTATVRSRAGCHCPSATSAQIDQSLTPDFGAVLAAIEAKADASTNLRQTCGLAWTVDQLGQYFQQFNLPSSCSSAGYNTGSACNMKLPVPNFGDLTLQLSVQKCPGKTAFDGSLPSISLSCSGALCTDLLVPCATKSDCMSSECTLLTPTTTDQIQAGLANWLDTTGLMPLVEQNNCATTSGKFSSSNVGSKVFASFMKIFGDRTLMNQGRTTSAGISSVGFCGVSPFLPAHFDAIYTRFPILNSLPGIGGSSFLSNALSAVIGLWYSPPTSYFNGQWTVYVAPSTGWDMLAAQVSRVLSFLQPIETQLAPLFTLNKTVTPNQILVSAIVAWDGLLADGTSVSDTARRSGAVFPTFTSTLPTPSMAASGVTSVHLLSSSCNLTVNALAGQPVNLAFYGPAFNELYSSVFQIVNDIQTCRLSSVSVASPLSENQLFTRFNIISPEFWMNLVSLPWTGGFTPDPAESVLSDISQKIYPSGVPTRMTMPSSCTFAQYSSTGQCSFQYTYLSQLFTNKDLTIRVNIQRCSDYHASLPSVDIQCTGADCATFLNPTAQVKYCAQDSDCGATGKHCQLIDTKPANGYLSRTLGIFKNSSYWTPSKSSSSVLNGTIYSDSSCTSNPQPFTATYPLKYCVSIGGSKYVTGECQLPNSQNGYYGYTYFSTFDNSSTCDYNSRTGYYSSYNGVNTTSCIPLQYSNPPAYVEFSSCAGTAYQPGYTTYVYPSCDAGLKNAQALYNFGRTLIGQDQMTFPDTATTFGICTLDAQDSLVANTGAWSAGAGKSGSSFGGGDDGDGTPGDGTTSRNQTTITATGFNMYSAPQVNNSLFIEAAGGAPNPQDTVSGAIVSPRVSFLTFFMIGLVALFVRQF